MNCTLSEQVLRQCLSMCAEIREIFDLKSTWQNRSKNLKQKGGAIIANQTTAALPYI